MGDEHLDTISSIEILVPILSEFEGISDDTCDVPIRDDSSTFDALNDDSEILSNSNDDDTSSDDDDFEDVEYISLKEVNDEKEFDLEDIFQSKTLFFERISKKKTKNKAKTTKPDSEWKSRKKTKSKSKPKPEKVNRKSTQVNPEAKSQEKQV
ncbi:hypothetical protein Tco_0398448 [Tanacetum coccineum]